jgi:hypothetical protein
MDLGQSRHSHQSNKIAPSDYVHLQKSSKSSNNSQLYFSQKPKSISTLNYNNIQPQQGHLLANQPQFHLQNPNVMILPPSHTGINSNFGHPSQFPPYHNERIVMVSSPPSFRFMNPSNNGFYQQNQPINLPPPSLVSFQNSHFSNQAF